MKEMLNVDPLNRITSASSLDHDIFKFWNNDAFLTGLCHQSALDFWNSVTSRSDCQEGCASSVHHLTDTDVWISHPTSRAPESAKMGVWLSPHECMQRDERDYILFAWKNSLLTSVAHSSWLEQVPLLRDQKGILGRFNVNWESIQSDFTPFKDVQGNLMDAPLLWTSWRPHVRPHGYPPSLFSDKCSCVWLNERGIWCRWTPNYHFYILCSHMSQSQRYILHMLTANSYIL